MQLTATQARNQFFDLINSAYYAGQVTEVMKNGRVVARVVPVEAAPFDWKAYRAELKKVVGMFTEADYKAMANARESFKSRFPSW